MTLCSRRSRLAKRTMDLVLALPVLLASLPLQAFVALLVRCTSPGPVIYRATRIGYAGEPFTMCKFRTMYADVGGIAVTSAEDVRVTAVGRWLRKLKLDELPQLFHVVLGDMSLVGRRPEDPAYVALYTEEQRRVLQVPPAITGPAMVVNEEGLLDAPSTEEVHRLYVEEIMPAKIAIDLQYLDTWSPLTDLRILLSTLAAMTHGHRSSSQSRAIGGPP